MKKISEKILIFIIVTLLLEKNIFFFTTNFLILKFVSQPDKVISYLLSFNQTDNKIQNKISMDWSLHDEIYLLKVAQYYSGTVENRAYTILVTLNKCLSEGKTIETIVKEQIESNKLEEIVPDQLTEQALNKVMMENFDNSNGSVDYIRWE